MIPYASADEKNTTHFPCVQPSVVKHRVLSDVAPPCESILSPRRFSWSVSDFYVKISRAFISLWPSIAVGDQIQQQIRLFILDFKLSPCTECCMLSSG